MPTGQFTAKPIHDAQRQFMARTEICPLCGPFFSVTVSSTAGGYIVLRSSISNATGYISKIPQGFISLQISPGADLPAHQDYFWLPACSARAMPSTAPKATPATGQMIQERSQLFPIKLHARKAAVTRHQ